MHKIILEDVESIIATPVRWEALKNKSVLVTGATGMIGSYLVHVLSHLNQTKATNIQIFVLARDKEKVMSVFGDATKSLHLIIGDVSDAAILPDQRIDVIFHTASPANPASFKEEPVTAIK